MFNYGFFSFDSKEDLLNKAAEYWNPGKVKFWSDAGTPMVIDRREEYFLYRTNLICLWLSLGSNFKCDSRRRNV